MNVNTTDQILDVSTANGANATLEGIQSADYGRYSQVTLSQKACISTNGCVTAWSATHILYT